MGKESRMRKYRQMIDPFSEDGVSTIFAEASEVIDRYLLLQRAKRAGLVLRDEPIVRITDDKD